MLFGGHCILNLPYRNMEADVINTVIHGRIIFALVAVD